MAESLPPPKIDSRIRDSRIRDSRIRGIKDQGFTISDL
jgi:hypothetical protein